MAKYLDLKVHRKLIYIFILKSITYRLIFIVALVTYIYLVIKWRHHIFFYFYKNKLEAFRNCVRWQCNRFIEIFIFYNEKQWHFSKMFQVFRNHRLLNWLFTQSLYCSSWITCIIWFPTIVCAFPYILGFSENSIEIRLMVNGNLVHTQSVPHMKLITAKVPF